MNYNFDEVIDRKGTNANKIELCKEIFGTSDLMPLWIADMDFRTPEFILDAIRQRLTHPILGYTVISDTFYEDLISWVSSHHGWHIQREWIGFLAGIVPGLAHAVNAFTQPGDEVIVQPPVYPPFLHVPEKNGRKVICNPLKEVQGKFQMDFDDLEQKITEKTKMLILCNPHNPGGRVWGTEILQKLAHICATHNILVVSDEIHADMALPGYKHVPFAMVSQEAAQNSITYMAPSKTFNMPGLVSSSFIIPNKELKQRFAEYLDNSELNVANLLSLAATHVAYTQGNEWRMQMLDYVQANINYAVDFLKQELPQVKVMLPEASFLLWLNFSELGYTSEQLQHKMVCEAKVGLNQGTTFGQGGEQHLRLNVACARSILTEALTRIVAVLK